MALYFVSPFSEFTYLYFIQIQCRKNRVIKIQNVYNNYGIFLCHIAFLMVKLFYTTKTLKLVDFRSMYLYCSKNTLLDQYTFYAYSLSSESDINKGYSHKQIKKTEVKRLACFFQCSIKI